MNNSRIRKKYLLIGGLLLTIVFIIFGGGYLREKWTNIQKEPVPEAILVEVVRAGVKESKEAETKDPIPEQVPPQLRGSQDEVPPKELNLKMTFYSQAPFADWSLPWQEACEEASVLLIANTYYQHNWTKTEFNDQILKLVEWEKETFGHYEHTDMAETQIMLDLNLGLKSEIHENPSFEEIQKILARGNLIVMPLAGKLVGNPNYRNGGPNYHVVVVKGYLNSDGEDKLITDDVGTRNGEDYVYKWATIEAALHDYAEPIESGVPRIIEVFQPQK